MELDESALELCIREADFSTCPKAEAEVTSRSVAFALRKQCLKATSVFVTPSIRLGWW
jgi:hypothetical protein